MTGQTQGEAVGGAVSAVVVPLASEHAEQVLAIYQAGIDEGNATFETSPPSWETFDAAKLPEHRFAALDADRTVLGWVAASRVSDRCAYAGVVEHSVYVHPAARGPQRRLRPAQGTGGFH